MTQTDMAYRCFYLKGLDVRTPNTTGRDEVFDCMVGVELEKNVSMYMAGLV